MLHCGAIDIHLTRLPSELHPTPMTQPPVADNSRAQLFLFALLSFAFDVIQLLFGFPETDMKIITLLYGQRFANVYKFIGGFTGAVKLRMVFTAACIICLIAFCDIY